MAAPEYQSGFGNEFATEAVAGALPQGQNSPQQVAFGLYAGALQGVKNLGVHVEVMPAVVTSSIVLALALLTSLVAVRRVLRIDPIAATTGAGVHL